MAFKDLCYAAAQGADGTATAVYGFESLEPMAEVEYGGAAAPTISIGSEPWFGGTVSSADGTEWYINGLPMSPTETGSTYVVSASDCSIGDTITRYDSATGLESGGLTVERVRGITIGASERCLRVSAASNTTNNFTIASEFILTGGDGTTRTIAMWARRTGTAALRKGVSLRFDTSGDLLFVAWDGDFAADVNETLSTGISTSTRYLMMVTCASGTDFKVYIGEPGGSATEFTPTSATASIATSNTTVTVGGNQIAASGSPDNLFYGTISACGLQRTASAAEFDDLLAAGSLEADGWDSDGSLVWYSDPETDNAEGDEILLAADYYAPAGETWGNAGSGAWNGPTAGGLNQATTAVV